MDLLQYINVFLVLGLPEDSAPDVVSSARARERIAFLKLLTTFADTAQDATKDAQKIWKTPFKDITKKWVFLQLSVT